MLRLSRALGELTLCLLSVAGASARAQARETAMGVPARCGLRARPLVPQNAAIPDSRAAPVAVLVDGGILVAWRTVDGAIELSRLDSRLERRAEDRELARQAGPFAMVSAPGGAVIVVAQRSGDDMVLLSRVSATGEARNVPRLVGRATGIDGVAIAPTASGFTVAWGLPAGSDAGTYALATDGRGVPLGSPHRILDGSLPHMTYLPAAQLTAIDGAGASSEPELVLVDAAGSVSERTHWLATTHGLVPSPSGGAVLATQLSLASDGLSALGLVRWAGGSTLPVALDLPAHFPTGSWLVDIVPDRVGVLVAVDDPTGHETVVRAGLDGTSLVLAVRPGSLGSIVTLDDGSEVIVGHEPPPAGRGRIALVQLVCPRGSDDGAATGANAVHP